MSADQMEFPKDWHEFLDDNSFIDTEEYYTNGAYLITKLRAQNALEHYVDGLIECVLELIDKLNDTKALVEDTPLGCYLHKTFARKMKEAVKELRGGDTVMTVKALRETLDIDDDAYVYVSVSDENDKREIYAIVEPEAYRIGDDKRIKAIYLRANKLIQSEMNKKVFEQFQNREKFAAMDMAIDAQENDCEEETTEEDE